MEYPSIEKVKARQCNLHCTHSSRSPSSVSPRPWPPEFGVWYHRFPLDRWSPHSSPFQLYQHIFYTLLLRFTKFPAWTKLNKRSFRSSKCLVSGLSRQVDGLFFTGDVGIHVDFLLRIPGCVFCACERLSPFIPAEQSPCIWAIFIFLLILFYKVFIVSASASYTLRWVAAYIGNNPWLPCIWEARARKVLALRMPSPRLRWKDGPARAGSWRVDSGADECEEP